MEFVLLVSVFIVASCGLIYELVAGTLASYLLGDSVTQFSTVIGVYLSAMGVGSYLSKYCKKDLLITFVKVEILIGLIGGISAAFLFFIFDYAYSFRVVLYLVVFITGVLVGLEIPLLMRILKERLEFADLVSKVLSFDYIGALVASVIFPLILVPHLGLLKTCFMFGILNVLVGFWAITFFSEEFKRHSLLKLQALLVLLILTFGFVYSDKILDYSEAALYPSRVIYSKSTPYQRVVVTNSNNDTRLYLNGHLQFSSRDEYRYHEALVHVGLAGKSAPEDVLILGGGDGMALREILKYPEIKSVTLVDLDPAITNLFRQNVFFAALNDYSLNSAKVNVVNEDAFLWIKENKKKFAYIIMDLPDPTSYSIGKLYTTFFFNSVKDALSDQGKLVVQSTSPLLARKSFWCVDETMRQIGLHTKPFHVYVPSFGEWGFILASKSEIETPKEVRPGLRYLNADALSSMFFFPKDMDRPEVEANKLNNQVLTRYYEDEWSNYIE